MPSQNLANLTKTGQLKAEPPSRKEFDGLVRSARARLKDAHMETLSIESRFDLGYNASHALALAALRWHGYRSENRYIVFQCLQHTLDFGPGHWRILALCHERRNLAEYEGHLEIDEQLVKEPRLRTCCWKKFPPWRHYLDGHITSSSTALKTQEIWKP